MLFHGYSKFNFGIGFIEGMLAQKGWPTLLAYGVYVGEIIAPLLLIIGYKTRLSALVIMINMLFAIYLVHLHELTALTKNGGLVLELQYFYIGTTLCVMLFGAGKYSMDKE
jgi:putative oxidoreductase